MPWSGSILLWENSSTAPTLVYTLNVNLAFNQQQLHFSLVPIDADMRYFDMMALQISKP